MTRAPRVRLPADDRRLHRSAHARAWRALAVVLWLAGAGSCGGSQRASDGDHGSEHATGSASPAKPAPAADSRTPIEQRRDAACERLAPKITACAVEDARAKLAAGKIDQ